MARPRRTLFRSGTVLGAVIALLLPGAPVAATTPAIRLERGTADEHGCRSLELWNDDTPVRTFAAGWAPAQGSFAGNCSRQDRTAWLGGLFLFDWWGPTTGAGLGATSTGTLWATDGSDAGTLAVADLFLNDSYYCEDHSEWFHAGNAVFVHQPHSGAGMCGAFGEGDLKGTTGLRPVVLLTHDAYGLQPFSGGLLMVADDGRTGDEVHVTDGTVAGTRVLRDIDRGRAGSQPTLLDRYGGRFLFTADDSLHGRELWVTDGTRRGTSLVRDIWPGHHGAAFGAGSFPESFRLPSAHLRHRVYFAANDGVHGNELWVTDGTQRGTHLVKDIRSGPRGSRVIDLKAAGTTLCFRADVGRGWTDWVSDGTAAGTHRGRCPSSET